MLWRRRIAKYGHPEIFNTDQGRQFTAEAFTDTLRSRGITISMDGKGCWMDNVFRAAVEKRQVRGYLPEGIWFNGEVKKGLATYFMFYNERRWHQNFDRKTPAMVYFSIQPQKQAAA